MMTSESALSVHPDKLSGDVRDDLVGDYQAYDLACLGPCLQLLLFILEVIFKFKFKIISVQHGIQI